MLGFVIDGLLDLRSACALKETGYMIYEYVCSEQRKVVSGKEELGEVEGVSQEVIIVIADMPGISSLKNKHLRKISSAFSYPNNTLVPT